MRGEAPWLKKSGASSRVSAGDVPPPELALIAGSTPPKASSCETTQFPIQSQTTTSHPVHIQVHASLQAQATCIAIDPLHHSLYACTTANVEYATSAYIHIITSKKDRASLQCIRINASLKRSSTKLPPTINRESWPTVILPRPRLTGGVTGRGL